MTLILSILLLAAELFLKESNLIWQPLVLLASFLTLPVILFSAPSAYVKGGLATNVIRNLANYIMTLNFQTIEKLEAIEQGIEKFRSRANSRISVYKWYLVSAWGVVVFLFGVVTKEIVSAAIKGGDIDTSFMNGAALFFTIFLILTFNIIPMILFAAYKRAVDNLFMIVEFSLLEAKIQITEIAAKSD